MPARNGRAARGDLERLALPARFLTEWLPAIDDLAELKVTLFCLAALEQKEGKLRYLRFDELLADESLMRGLAIADKVRPAREVLNRALDRAVERGALLEAAIDLGEFFFVNDAGGKQLQAQVLAGEWLPAPGDAIEILPPRPTIYRLYEENIGPLTPMIADSLKEAEASYPRAWIDDAMRLSAENNKRSWRYIRAILERWRQEGRSHEKSRRHPRRRKR